MAKTQKPNQTQSKFNNTNPISQRAAKQQDTEMFQRNLSRYLNQTQILRKSSSLNNNEDKNNVSRESGINQNTSIDRVKKEEVHKNKQKLSIDVMDEEIEERKGQAEVSQEFAQYIQSQIKVQIDEVEKSSDESESPTNKDQRPQQFQPITNMDNQKPELSMVKEKLSIDNMSSAQSTGRKKSKWKILAEVNGNQKFEAPNELDVEQELQMTESMQNIQIVNMKLDQILKMTRMHKIIKNQREIKRLANQYFLLRKEVMALKSEFQTKQEELEKNQNFSQQQNKSKQF